jgi:hypothetical protein
MANNALNTEETFQFPVQRNCATLLLKGQSHKKVGDLRVWGISLGPN